MTGRKRGLLSSLIVLAINILIIAGVLILYPFWLLFSLIVNLIGVKGIHSTGSELQTPVVFYEHPASKRVVAFFAMIHIGEPEYYAALQTLIESLTGYTILFEGLGKLSPEEELALTAKERYIASDFEHLFSAMRKITQVMALKHQREGLSYASSWVNNDMRFYDLIRLFAAQNIMPKGDRAPSSLLDDAYDWRFAKWMINKILCQMVPVSVLFGILSLLSRKKQLTKKFILDERNAVAMTGVNQHLEKGDIALVWGAAHLKGIERELKRLGFHEVGRQWFTAYRDHNYSLFGDSES